MTFPSIETCCAKKKKKNKIKNLTNLGTGARSFYSWEVKLACLDTMLDSGCIFFFNGWMKQQPSLKEADLCVMKPFKRPPTQLKIPIR